MSIKVKALEWWENTPNPSGLDTWSYIGECQSLLGFYRVGRAADGWVTRFNGGPISRAERTLEEAKGAAQADFNTRILSAIEEE